MVFKTTAIDHSAISPLREFLQFRWFAAFADLRPVPRPARVRRPACLAAARKCRSFSGCSNFVVATIRKCVNVWPSPVDHGGGVLRMTTGPARVRALWRLCLVLAGVLGAGRVSVAWAQGAAATIEIGLNPRPSKRRSRTRRCPCGCCRSHDPSQSWSAELTRGESVQFRLVPPGCLPADLRHGGTAPRCRVRR